MTASKKRLALNEGKSKDHYTTSTTPTNRPAKTSTPNNLPRLQPFFGRTEELKQIAEALDPESRTWGALIDGPGGMGKTSLAVRAAYDCPPGQFQRIIFVSVKPLNVFNYSIRNEKKSGVIDVHIDGAIVDAESQQVMKDWFGDETSVSFKSIRNQIEDASPKTVNVHINSVGGQVVDSMAIHDYLIELQGKSVIVNTYVKGLAASAATFIAMASDNSHMSENSWLMIHNMSGAIYGDVYEIENYAKMIRKFNNSARDFYAQKTGLRPEDITRYLDNETWFSAAEAKEKGFIKNVTGAANFTNSIKPEHWQFKNQIVLNSYNSFTQNLNDMNIKEIIKNTLKELGFSKAEDETKVDAAAEKISNAIGDALKPENLKEIISPLVNEAITDAVKNIKVAPEALAEEIKNQVTASVKDFATKEDVAKLTNSIAEKLGGSSKEKDDADPKERKIENKKAFFSVGDFEKN